MRIAVCGDSWMSPSFEEKFIGTHFAELLCKEQNWQLEYYARPGASNGFICLQIEQAIKDKCDIILFGTTTYNRIEYALGESNFDPSHTWGGCKDIDMTHVAPPSLKIRHDNNKFEIVSDNLMNLLGYKQNFINYEKHFMNTPDDDIEAKFNALKDWFTFLYHPAWKQKIDRWCLEAVLLKLKKSNIPYAFVIDFVGIPDCDYIDKPVLGDEYASHKYVAPDNSATYHTSKEIQVKILHLVKERLKEKGISLV